MAWKIGARVKGRVHTFKSGIDDYKGQKVNDWWLKQIKFNPDTDILIYPNKLPEIFPRIVREKQLNTDPCIDDVDIKTDNIQGAVKFIVLGLIVGLILGIIK